MAWIRAFSPKLRSRATPWARCAARVLGGRESFPGWPAVACGLRPPRLLPKVEQNFCGAVPGSAASVWFLQANLGPRKLYEQVAEWRRTRPRYLTVRGESTRQKVRSRRWFCWPVVCAVTVAGGLAWPVSVRADPVNLNPCNNAALSQPFAPWADMSWYELAPGGDFESLDWSFQGGAELVAGSEPYASTGELGGFSLSLPLGASAMSPLTCVDAAYPSIRLFIAGTGSVAVDLLSGGLDIPCGVAVAGGPWLPTPVMVTTSAVMAALSGGTAKVSLRVTALTGNPQIDDVWVDPWNRG
jgi:hypothetical protein